MDFTQKHSTFFATPSFSGEIADKETTMPESLLLGLLFESFIKDVPTQGIIGCERIPQIRRRLIGLHANKKTPSEDAFKNINGVLIEAQKNSMPIYYIREKA